MTSTAIAVFAYRRPEHLMRVLDALAAQSNGCSLSVCLFLDGARSPDEDAAIAATRQVADNFRDRLSLLFFPSERNQGLYSSLTKGIGAVLASFDQVIVLEDDIVVSPYFLDYMLQALACYSSEPMVASVHGYVPPMALSLPETFLLRGADCWGWATWRDRWALFRHDAGAMAAEIRSRGLSRSFNLGGRVPNLRMLDDRAAGRSNSWAICWHASCFLAGCYTLHPGRSLVRNIGLDHSGEHCVPSADLEAVLTQRPLHVQRQSLEENPLIVEAFSRQIAPPALPLRAMRRVQRFLSRKLSSGGRVL